MIFHGKTIGRKSLALVVAVAVCSGLLTGGSAEASGQPAKPSVSLVKRTKTTATIKIKKKGTVTGYQIAVATSKKGKYKIVPTKMRTYKMDKLKKNKVYYVKVRAFRTKGYRIQYGKYSKVLKIGKYTKPKKNVPVATPTPTQTPVQDQFFPLVDIPLPDKTPMPEESMQPESSEQPDGITPSPESGMES